MMTYKTYPKALKYDEIKVGDFIMYCPHYSRRVPFFGIIHFKQNNYLVAHWYNNNNDTKTNGLYFVDGTFFKMLNQNYLIKI